MHAAHQDYSFFLVALSYVVAVLGSFTALQLAIAIPVARAGQRWRAVLAAGTAVGVGAIWTMHFLGMLACDVGMEVAYDIPMTVLSALIALVACSLGFGLAGSGAFSWPKLVSGGVCMGLGVAGMHYLGMMAMLMPATMEYNTGLVALSVAIAIVASIAALWLAFNLRGRWQMVGSALVMGLAVCGMHYTGMAAVEFIPNGGQLPANFEQGLRGDYLGMSIFVVAVLLLMITLMVNVFRQQRRAALSI
ncbi:MHYT domain-containing protein [Lysobacter sp. A286]